MAALIAAGSAARLALAFESTYGVNPGSGFQYIPAINYDLAENQPFLAPDLIGQGRAPGRPERDVAEAGGRPTVPIDARNSGFWLKALIGAPTTSGTNPYTHTFESGKDTLLSMSIEEQHPDIATPEYHLAVGVMLNGLTFRAEPRGRASFDLDLLAQSKTRALTTGAGTPATEAVTRFGQIHSFIKLDDVDLGKIVSCNIPFTNNLDINRYVGGGGAIGDIIPGLEGLQGEIEARLHPGLSDIWTHAAANTVFKLEVGYSIDANTSITFEMGQVEITKPRKTIAGPGGVEVRYPFAASSDGASIKTLKVVLVNDVASYA